MGLYDVAVHFQTVVLVFGHFNHVRGHFLAEYRKYRRNQFALAIRGKDLLAIANQRERDFRMRQRRVLYDAKHVARLGEVLFEKLHSRRCVIKQGRALQLSCPSGQPASSFT